MKQYQRSSSEYSTILKQPINPRLFFQNIISPKRLKFKPFLNLGRIGIGRWGYLPYRRNLHTLRNLELEKAFGELQVFFDIAEAVFANITNKVK